MIFSRKLEVQKSHSNERGDNHEQNKGQEENSKQRVDLVSPHGGENVVELNVNREKGRKPAMRT